MRISSEVDPPVVNVGVVYNDCKHGNDSDDSDDSGTWD